MYNDAIIGAVIEQCIVVLLCISIHCSGRLRVGYSEYTYHTNSDCGINKWSNPRAMMSTNRNFLILKSHFMADIVVLRSQPLGRKVDVKASRARPCFSLILVDVVFHNIARINSLPAQDWRKH